MNAIFKHAEDTHVETTIIKRAAQRLTRDDAGLTTAEYAVGTVAVAGLGGLLLQLLTSDPVRDLLWGLFSSALSSFFG
jgi:Flp pilus assembly pilin Flp